MARSMLIQAKGDSDPKGKDKSGLGAACKYLQAEPQATQALLGARHLLA